MYHYTSKTTQFIQEFLEKNPKEQDLRLKHRNKLWDVELNNDELTQFKLGEISKRPYTYFPNVGNVEDQE